MKKFIISTAILLSSVLFAKAQTTFNGSGPIPFESYIVRLPPATSVSSVDLFYILQGGISKNVNALAFEGLTPSGITCLATSNYQLFANTASAPTGTTLNFYDGTQCVPFLILNQTTHTITFIGAMTASSLDVTGGITAPGLPSSAGSGGLYICIDNTGVLYKKSSCP